jgi:hypothetical protein
MSSTPQLQVLYNSTGGLAPPLSSANSPLISDVGASLLNNQTVSIELLTQGTAAVDWQLQVTNFPQDLTALYVSYQGRTIRDDSFASPMWQTVANGTGTVPVLAGGNATMIVLPSVAFRHCRLTMAWTAGNTAGATTSLFAILCRTVV